MKKILLMLLLLISLVGCNLQDEESFIVFNEVVYLTENEGIYIPVSYTGIKEDQISITFSNEDILELNKEDLFIKAKKIGFTTINISVDDSNYNATIEVYVESKNIIAPEMLTSNRDMIVSNPVKLYITNLEKLGAPLESYTFTLSDEALANLDENFIIHPKAPGTLTITATHKTNPEITSSFSFNIVPKEYSEKLILTAKDNSFVVKPGEYLDLYIDGKRENTESDYYFFSWTDYASITADGRIAGIKNGIAYIGAQSKTTGKSGVIYIEVKGEENKVDYIERLIEIALSENGYREGKNGWTKFGEWYDQHYALLDWCAMFVAYSANEAGIPTTIIPRLAKVEFIKNFYERKKLFEYRGNYTPKRGDIIIFEDTSHVGIVLYVENGRVYTIEGNTSNMVAPRNYNLNDTYILGYGLPEYDKLNF